jgi:hypothetical protein
VLPLHHGAAWAARRLAFEAQRPEQPIEQAAALNLLHSSGAASDAGAGRRVAALVGFAFGHTLSVTRQVVS